MGEVSRGSHEWNEMEWCGAYVSGGISMCGEHGCYQIIPYRAPNSPRHLIWYSKNAPARPKEKDGGTGAAFDVHNINVQLESFTLL